ncbi:hypothetical protein HOLleu_13293 [Holothuria leucospilota]|uniref:Uncharacterized protein n=1 Tax=Holothuria leucospilota TaxID=206669 RepID=A0A9Q1CCR6_HOLLE|nr:hypothetical protein HOLleu_13293 [Holothuria leucospilota]
MCKTYTPGYIPFKVHAEVTPRCQRSYANKTTGVPKLRRRVSVYCRLRPKTTTI